MKENKNRSPSGGRLRLVKSSPVACKKKNQLSRKELTMNEIDSQWVNYHYSYAEFIHYYVEHINNIQRSTNSRENSKFMKLFKAEAANN